MEQMALCLAQANDFINISSNQLKSVAYEVSIIW